MEQHKKWVSQIFDSTSSHYGENSSSFFKYFGKQLVEQVHVAPQQHVLDIATGKGAVIFPLAEKIGPLGRVVGVDISEQMLKENAKIAMQQGMEWIELLHMDAEKLNFPDHSFDVVFCGFALFFFPNMSKALSEFKRVLRPGGHLAVSTWGEDSQLDKLINDEIHLLHQANGQGIKPLWTSLAISPLWSSQALQNALDAANFKNIRITEEIKEIHHVTAEEWWNSLWAHGTRAKLEQLSAKQLTELHENVMAKAKTFDLGNGLTEELQVFYGIAQQNES